MSLKGIITGIFTISVAVIPSIAHAQSFYGGNEYMDHPVTAPPPDMREFTHLLPPPPPPSSPANAWQRDGYRRGDVGSPWSAPVYGQFNAPVINRTFEGWSEPAFASYMGMPYYQSTNGYSSTGTSVNSKACVDGNCIGG